MCGVAALNELKCLAEDDAKYAALLKDIVSLQGLVLLLSNNDMYIVKSVLQILTTLSKRPGAKSQLKVLMGLQEELKRLSGPLTKATNSLGEVQQLAEDLLIWLFQIEEKPREEISKSRRQTSVDPSRFRPKCVILQLYGLRNETDIDTVCSRLLTVRGVVSITFQLSKRRVLVCTVPDLSPELLIQAVTQTRSDNRLPNPTDNPQPNSDQEPVITAQIVRKKNRMQSMCRSNSRYRSRRGPHPFKPNPGADTSGTTNNLPPYLDEDADLFEVDESKAAPKLKNQSPHNQSNDTRGPINWLSDFLERSLFW